MKILIVEDDIALNKGIAMSFRGEQTVQAFCLKEAEKLFDVKTDLVLLDVNLPDGSGVDFCRKIRMKSNVPVILLTANDLEIDIVTGLESGADDYVTKPFSLAVLRARVSAVTRRRGAEEKESGLILPNKPFIQEKFSFDFENMLFLWDGISVELSKTEQKLLRLLVSNGGRTLPRELLAERIWADGAEFVEENALSVTVSRLREKLPGAPIKTVYGIGYTWEI